MRPQLLQASACLNPVFNFSNLAQAWLAVCLVPHPFRRLDFFALVLTLPVVHQLTAAKRG